MTLPWSGVHKFPKNYNPPHNSRCQKITMKQFPYWRYTNIKMPPYNKQSPGRTHARDLYIPALPLCFKLLHYRSVYCRHWSIISESISKLNRLLHYHERLVLLHYFEWIYEVWHCSLRTIKTSHCHSHRSHAPFPRNWILYNHKMEVQKHYSISDWYVLQATVIYIDTKPYNIFYCNTSTYRVWTMLNTSGCTKHTRTRTPRCGNGHISLIWEDVTTCGLIVCLVHCY